jgi:peroxiredoxin
MTSKLAPDTQVPALSVDTLNNGRWELAAQRPDNFTMVVFYRGYHCPVCKSYLQKLESIVDGYFEAGFAVLAVSMDDRDRAQKSAQEWALSKVPVGYGLSEAAARDWGLYISKAIKDVEADIFCEPGLFWVRPDGRLYLGDVSNMPWSRPDVEFLLSKVPFAVDNNYPARGSH